MVKLIASYFIETDDKNVFLVLDSEIWRTLSKLPGESAESGLWYLNTDLSPDKVCQTLVEKFNKKKKELEISGIKKAIINETKISINIHELSGDNWITFNDQRIVEWFKSQEVDIQKNIKSEDDYISK